MHNTTARSAEGNARACLGGSKILTQTLKTISNVRTGSRRGVQVGPGGLNMPVQLLFREQLSSSPPLLAVSWRAGYVKPRLQCHSASEEIQISAHLNT